MAAQVVTEIPEKSSPEGSTQTTSLQDPNLVTWTLPSDPENPLEWSTGKRWGTTILVSIFMFISPFSSSMVAPAFGPISKEFGIQSLAETQSILSVFILASAVGPLLVAPMSEVYGRTIVLQITCLVFLIFNVACGFCRNKTQLVVFRFMSGLGGSAPALGGGLLADCWKAEERGRSLALYYIAPLLGPALGPIAGGYITQYMGWRWLFHLTSILDIAIQLTGLLFLHETYAPLLLARRSKRLMLSTSNSNLYTPYSLHDQRPLAVIRTALIRPTKLLVTQPIIQVLALYVAYVYGLLYLMLSTFVTLWIHSYHESTSTAGLNYASIGLGFLLGTQICAPINDRIYAYLKIHNGGIGLPEFRAVLLLPSALLIPLGFLIYGWSSQHNLHYVLPNLGACLAAAGIIVGMQTVTAYIVDSYGIYSASAVAATTVLRSVAGFAFPLFAPYMYQALDLGWGNTLLAGLAVCVCWPAPFLLWRYGAILRAKSPYAAAT